jgi:four helix bundle protein
MEAQKNYEIKELSLEFSLLLIDYLQKPGKEKTLLNPNQLLRSGTGIGANIREAQGAESRKDFVHKMKIAYKEAEESEYWILLFKKSDPDPILLILQDQILQIKKMLGKIISTSLKNMNKLAE